MSYDRGIRSRWKLGGHPRRCWNICFLSRALLSSCAVHLIQHEVLHITFSPRFQAFVSSDLWHPAGTVFDSAWRVWMCAAGARPFAFCTGLCLRNRCRERGARMTPVGETARWAPERRPRGQECAVAGPVTQHRLFQIHGASGGEVSRPQEKPPKLQAVK